jgi:hypothetical protein
MTPAEFRRYVNAYGGTLARWPESLRGAAAALLATTPELGEVLTRAGALDEALAAQRPAISSARLRSIEQTILARTAAPRSLAARLRDWLTLGELAPIAAGVVLALTISWAVRENRPAEALTADAQTNGVMAMIEFDANGLGVL